MIADRDRASIFPQSLTNDSILCRATNVNTESGFIPSGTTGRVGQKVPYDAPLARLFTHIHMDHA